MCVETEESIGEDRSLGVCDRVKHVKIEGIDRSKATMTFAAL